MGLLKNTHFLDLLQKEQERDRMELARREQNYINSRKAQPAKAKTQTPPHKGK